jgi:DNA (cytosine-5)-methyltransferase 1
MNYYNDNSPFICEWVRNLIKAGLVPQGDVDERSIKEVTPGDLKGYDQCHFFCGILGWPLALQLAGVPSTEPCWTGSVPCQPWSGAGDRKGFADERHLWPAFFDLIKVCRPQKIYGEQVEAAIKYGWLDLVFGLEGEGYACGAVVLPACGVGAPHRRDRLYWCGVLEHAEVAGVRGVLGIVPSEAGSESAAGVLPEPRRAGEGSMADADQQLREHDRIGGGGEREIEDDQSGRHAEQLPRAGGSSDGLGHADDSGQRMQHLQRRLGEPSSAGTMADAAGSRREGGAGIPRVSGSDTGSKTGGLDYPNSQPAIDEVCAGRQLHGSSGPNFWDDCCWIECGDGKRRPVESISSEMVDGFPDGMGLVRDGDKAIISPLIQETENLTQRLKGYGNSLVPQVAAIFIRSTM